ncbi:MAG: hypothetical protein V8R51_03795 [Clostridia bacterium]
MASKLLKETKDTEINNKKQKARVEKDDIYKIDLELEQDNQNTEQFTQHDEKEKPKKASKAKAQSTKKKTRAKKEDNIIKIEDDEDEIDEIFGNVNKWLKDAEEVIENKPKRKLAKIEEGIKSSKTAKSNKGTTKTRKNSKIEEIEKVEDVDIKEEPVQAENVEKIEKVDEIEETEKIETKKAKKTTRAKTRATTKARTTSKSQIDDIYSLNNLEELDNEDSTKDQEYQNIEDDQTTNEKIRDGKIEVVEGKPSEIKIHAENDLTEIVLKKSRYKIELQKTEYNIYTDINATSYVIVRDPMLRIVSGESYILLEKQGENYEITTNQDFKINYVIDNLERKNNEVNFKLTNLTEIFAYEDGLVFEIDEEKVIENNLEDNNTLVISEEDGKVYLPYTKEDVKNEVLQNRGTKISDVIEEKYILPIEKYKNSMRARFREGYNLMYKKEGKSKKSAILLGIELMFETNLHPAIISACKNLEELDIYLDCLEDNELEKFSCFKIIYKSLPTIRKKAKFQEL